LVEGRVTRVLDFGAFVELDLGIEGLLHSSEMIGTPELPPSDIVHPGEKLLVKIIRIESRRRRLALSARQVRKSEWERWIAEQQTAHEAEEAKAREEAARVLEAEASEQAVPVPEAEASEQAAPVLEAKAPISEPVEVAEEAKAETEAEAIAPEEESPVGEAAEEAAPASESEMEEAVSSETEKVALDEETDAGSEIQAPEVAAGAQVAD
jgi:ribosomal protein S1